MTLQNIADTLGLKLRSNVGGDIDVISGYASDLLSDVLARSGKGTLWVTNQKHQNIIGVAVMLDLAGVIIAGGMEPEDNTLEKANEEGVPLYTTDMPLYEVVGKLYDLGIRAKKQE